MAARETLDQWADTLDKIGELYCHVIETVADIPEQSTDLAGSSSQGKPPPLPGGIKMALVGPHNVHAAPDGLAHPGVFLTTWCGHVGRRSRSIPPGRTRHLARWQAELIWLRERLQWITDEDGFQAELRAVHGLLRNVCNADRLSQGEAIINSMDRSHKARQEVIARLDEASPWFMLTRREAGLIWSVFRSPIDIDAGLEAHGGLGMEQRMRDARDDTEAHESAMATWGTVRDKTHKFRKSGDAIPDGKAPLFAVRATAEALSVTNA